MGLGSFAAQVECSVWSVMVECTQHSREGLRGTGHPALPALVMAHLHRLSRELQEKEKVIESLEAKLQERCESPGSSCPLSESSRSATSSSFVSEGLEPCSDGEGASVCSQCHKEPAQLPGTTGCLGATTVGWGHAAPLQHVGSCICRCPSGLSRGCPCGTVPQCQPRGAST